MSLRTCRSTAALSSFGIRSALPPRAAASRPTGCGWAATRSRSSRSRPGPTGGTRAASSTSACAAPEPLWQLLAERLAVAIGELRAIVSVLDRAHLLHRIGGRERRDATGCFQLEPAQQARDQPRPICVAGAGRVRLAGRRRGRYLDRLFPRRDARPVAPESRDDDLRQLEQALHVALGPLLDELELIVVAD